MKQSWRNTLPPRQPTHSAICNNNVYYSFLHRRAKTRKKRERQTENHEVFFVGISVWVRLKARLFWQIVSHNLWRVLFLHIAKNNKQNPLPLLLLRLLQMPHLIYGRSSECAAIGFYFISFHILLLFIDSFCCWPARLM